MTAGALQDLRSIRAVVFQEDGWWIGQCLEVDLARQTRRLEDLPRELQRLLAVQVAASAQVGVAPFAGLTAAPRRFWDMYEQARSRLEPVAGTDTTPAAAAAPSIETRVAA
jgi:hypothetical protein